jgi:hypothetical protein
MSGAHQFRKELKKESEHQQTDVHTVHIGIGGYYHLIISQPLQSFLNVEGRLQQVEFQILINHHTGLAETVERLAPKTENGLGAYIPALGKGATGRVALGEEDGRLVAKVTLGIIEMHTAVTQLIVVQADFFGTVTRGLAHSRYGLAFPLGILYLFQQHFIHLGMFVQIVVKFLLDEIHHKLLDRHFFGVVFFIGLM